VIGAYVALARAHAPLLLVLAPVVTAAFVFLIKSARLAWALAVAGALATGAIALELATATLTAMPAPAALEGIGIGVDAVGAYVAALLAVGSALATLAAGACLKDFGAKGAGAALAGGLIAASAWTSAVLARDLIGVFIAAETGWLASLGVAALGAARERGALNGAVRMLTIGGAGAALALLGAALLATSLGSAEIAALAGNWRGSASAAAGGVALLMLGFSIYAGMAPLHAWSPVTLARGSIYAALVIAVIGVVGALGAIARLAAFAFDAPAVGGGVSLALSGLGATSALVGSMQATGAANLRRLAAYAGAAQGGCILLAIALGSPAGFEAAFVQLFALTASMCALIGGAAAAGGEALHALDGLGRRAPLASVAIAAGALSLMGAPLTIGFLGRWRLIEAALGAGEWWIAAIVIAVSLAGVFYGGRLIERLYFRRATAAAAVGRDVWRFALTPALLFAIAAVALGLEPAALLNAAAHASMLVLGRAQ
jgi:multicomponent Na+:H+ antiporter subunit D